MKLYQAVSKLQIRNRILDLVFAGVGPFREIATFLKPNFSADILLYYISAYYSTVLYEFSRS